MVKSIKPSLFKSVRFTDLNNDGLIDFINVPDIYMNQDNGKINQTIIIQICKVY